MVASGFSPNAPTAGDQISSLIIGVVLIDDCGLISEVNHTAEDLIGKSAKQLIGAKAEDCLNLEDNQILGRIARGEGPLVARQVALNSNDNRKLVNLSLSPVASHDGWCVLTLAERGLGEDDKSAEHASLSGIGAPSILAHEIKNPLAAIRGAGQLIARKLEPADRGLSTLIADEVDRIAGLIDRMQLLGSQTQQEISPCNLHEAIRAAIATMRTARDGNFEIIEEFDPSLPQVLANKQSLEQVLINLLSNAFDAVKGEDRPAVSIKTRFVSGIVTTPAGASTSVKLPIEICVNDNGPGIPDDLIGHVFDPFVSTKKSGQGLGLALVQKLVRDMHGRISMDRDDVASQTNFRIHLQRSDSEEANT